MASNTTQDTKTMTLSATYTSPANAPFTITRELPAPPSGTANPTVTDKTAYLAALRAAVSSAQDEINKELTMRMEEDNSKARREALGDNDNNNGKGAVVDDAVEEENYGEEAQGEDA